MPKLALRSAAFRSAPRANAQNERAGSAETGARFLEADDERPKSGMASQSGTARLRTPRSPASAGPAPPLPVMTTAVFFPFAWQSCRKAKSRRLASSWRNPCRSSTAPGAVLPRRSRCSRRRSSVARGGPERGAWSRGDWARASAHSPSVEVSPSDANGRPGLPRRRRRSAEKLGTALPRSGFAVRATSAQTRRSSSVSRPRGRRGGVMIEAPRPRAAGARKGGHDGAGGPRASRPRPRCPRTGRHDRPRRSPRRYPARSSAFANAPNRRRKRAIHIDPEGRP